MLLSFVSHFGNSASGIGALGINGSAFLIQLITFLLVFWVLRRYAFKPILRVLNERHKLIENGVKLGEEMKKEKAELDEQVSDQLHKARAEADGIIATAKQQSGQLINESEQNAQTKAKSIIDEAKETIELETQRTRKRLEKDLVGLVSEVTEAIISEKLDPKKDAVLIDKALRSQK
ncbi:MAG TPA: F0F1 ATP synthase subunit B [Candidatus Saccharimonadales bacterium]|nr:F0F1 ATP synthase subunit B [Candidatus Saccharimonadales bacterium]